MLSSGPAAPGGPSRFSYSLTSEVQGEWKAEFTRAFLSRSLHSRCISKYNAKLLKISETTKYFRNFFRTFFEFNNPALWRDNAGLFTDKEGLFERDFPLRQEVIFTIVLAAWGQLVMLQRGQHFLKLQEEPFAGFVAVGVHVEAG